MSAHRESFLVDGRYVTFVGSPNLFRLLTKILRLKEARRLPPRLPDSRTEVTQLRELAGGEELIVLLRWAGQDGVYEVEQLPPVLEAVSP